MVQPTTFFIYLYNKPGNKFNQYEEEIGFVDIEQEFRKGIFEEFIESQGYQIHFDGSYTLYKYESGIYETESDKTNEFQRLFRRNSFEELLIWYFNN